METGDDACTGTRHRTRKVVGRLVSRECAGQLLRFSAQRTDLTPWAAAMNAAQGARAGGAGSPRARLGPQRGGDDRAEPEGAASRTDKRPIPGAPCSRRAEADSGLAGRTLRVMLCT